MNQTRASETPGIKEMHMEVKLLGVSMPVIDTTEGMGRVCVRPSCEPDELLAEARLVAERGTTVLILGESGTGKELLARAIHSWSARRDGQFVAINCSAIPGELMEAELFGYEKGAFTGAVRSHPGLLQAARGGTVFLDEIGDMPLHLQAKLLRVIEEHQVRPVGALDGVPLDIRVLSATHRDLHGAIADGNFREDLYYRLNVVTLEVPPLRSRREDIAPLAIAALDAAAKRHGRSSLAFEPDALRALQSYAWPGNVRELRNVVERLMLLASADMIDASTVRLALPSGAGLPSLQVSTGAAGVGAASGAPTSATDGPLAARVEAFERATILAELERQRHHMTNTARALGLERSHLYKKCQHLGIDLRALKGRE